MPKILRINIIVFGLLMSIVSFGQSWERYEFDQTYYHISDGNGGVFLNINDNTLGLGIYHYDRFGNKVLIENEVSFENLHLLKGKDKSVIKTSNNSLKQLSDKNSTIYQLNGSTITLYDYNLQIINTLSFSKNILSLKFFNGVYLITSKNNGTCYLSEIEINGTVKWEKSLSLFSDIELIEPIILEEGGFLLLGRNPNNLKKILRLDKNLALIWEKDLKYNRKLSFEVYSTSFFTFINNPDYQTTNIYQFNYDGDTLYKKTILGSNVDHFEYFEKDNSYIAVCTTQIRTNEGYISEIVYRVEMDKKQPTKSIKGKIFIDKNDDCSYNNLERPIQSLLIKKEPNPSYTFTDSLGNYEFKVDSGEIVTIKPAAKLPKNYSSDCHPERQVQITGNQTNSTGVDFPIHEELCSQLHISYSNSVYNRCFSGFHKFYINNIGTEIANNVQTEIVFPKEIIFKSVNQPYSFDNGIYKFNLSSIAPGEKIEIAFQDSIDCQTTIGFIAGNAKVSTSSSCALLDNAGDSLSFGGTIRGSYDPNDKSVFPSRINYTDYVNGNNSVGYHINFQNTGDGPASKVVIVDTLSGDLNFEGITNINTSHPYSLQIAQTNPVVLVWSFVNINLPGKEENEPNSHGYVSFNIPLKNELTNNTIIENRAGIYFDFNDPIITNTATITISEDYPTDSGVITSPKDSKFKTSVLIFPNPMNHSATVALPDVVSLPCSFSLINVNGVKVQEKTINSRESLLQAGNLQTGLYHYIINDGKTILEGNIMIK